ncbi:unnamed protein product [Moneuplotes crassus]|uniref:Nucleosome assembly protein n=1 Tax=Euplotes crassus TaxID=5936 RepID=A0AAD1XPT8_EUPCR|nr:unnamed protein product [Moneuplotes crassus]
MKKSDKELKNYEMRISNTVSGIDESVRDRFKALAHISNMLAEISKQYELEAKKIEFEAEQSNKPLYTLRSMIVQGKEIDGAEHMLQEFNQRFEESKNDDFDSIQVKEFKKVDQLADSAGVPGFWLNAMKHSTIASSLILKKDEPLLKELYDIELIPQEGSPDFILKFHFNANDFMTNTVLTKRYIMEDDDKVKQVDSTKIKWREGMSLTEKPKSKKKGKKNKYDEDGVESFFKFFDSKEPCVGNPDQDDLDSDDEMKLDRLEEDFDIAVEIKSELIPNALEYYLNIVEDEPVESEEGEDQDQEQDENEDDNASEDD